MLKDQDTDCLQFDVIQEDCQVPTVHFTSVIILAIFLQNLWSTEMINIVIIPYLQFSGTHSQLWSENIKWKVPEINNA